MRFTIALPMTTPSTICATDATWSGREMPNPRASGMSVWERTRWMRAGNAGGDAIARAGDSRKAHAIDETAGALCDGLNTIIRACGRDHVNEFKAVGGNDIIEQAGFLGR